MDQDRHRRPDNKEPIHRHQEGVAKTQGRHAADNTGAENPQGADSVGEAAKVRFTITARRVRIDPEEKRQQYIERLEGLVTQLDTLINSPRVARKHKLRAMEVLIKTINTCYGIVSDIEVEYLENELKELKREDQGTEEAKTLGYEIQEDPAQ